MLDPRQNLEPESAVRDAERSSVERTVMAVVHADLDMHAVLAKIDEYRALAAFGAAEREEYVRSDLDSPHPLRRAESVAALATICDPSLLPALVPAALSEPEQGVAGRAAIVALYIANSDRDAARPYLGAVSGDLRGAALLPDHPLRHHAYLLLMASGDLSVETLEALARGCGAAERNIARACACGLRDMGFEPLASISHLMTSPADTPLRERLAAMSHLPLAEGRDLSSEDDIAEFLEEASESPDPETRLYAVLVLARCSPQGATTARVVSRALGDPDDQVRMTAALSLVEVSDRLADPGALLAGTAALLDDPASSYLAASALCALARAALSIDADAPGLEQHLDKLYRLGRSESTTEREAALLCFSILGERAADALPEIGSCLKHPDERIRMIAHVAAAKIGESAAPLYKLIEARIGDDNPNIAGLSIAALGELEVSRDAVLPKLWDAYRTKGDDIKLLVMHLLAEKRWTGRSVHHLVEESLGSKAPLLRMAGLITIEESELRSPVLKEAVGRLRSDPDPEVAETATGLYEEM